MNGTRSFVAFGLSDEVVERLRDVRRTLLRLAPAWTHEKWVAEDNLHVTLKFLGNLDDAQLADIRAGLTNVLAETTSFPLSFAGVRAVPGLHRCSMLWARFDDADDQCSRLAALVEQAAAAIGVTPDRRDFSPHVTLVRARRPRRLHAEAVNSANEVACDPALSMSVLSVTLLASTLTRSGPVYEAIDSWTLKASG